MEKQEKIEAVQRMQDYIETHLQETITLHDLAKCAAYSPFHCTRMFKELVGKSPFDYIRLRRLTFAALKLRDEKVKIFDVALNFVFDSQEGFTRAFSKEFGIPPHRFSNDPLPVYLFMPDSVRERYRYFQKGAQEMTKKEEVKTVFVQVIERPERKLILKRGIKAEDYFEYCEEAGCDVWGLLCSIKEALYEPAGMWLPDNLRPTGTSYYVQGVEVPPDYKGAVPEGFELIELPACKMMIFQGPPYSDEDFEEAITDLWDAIKDYNPQLYGFKWADEDGPRFQLEPLGYRGYIEARPVRTIND